MKVDGLQWEVNRLDAENQKLRSQDPEGSARVDLQAELEQAQGDIAGLEEQLKSCQQRVTRSEKQAENERQRATEAESLAAAARQRMTTVEQETLKLREEFTKELGEAKCENERGRVSNSELVSQLATVSEDLAVAEERFDEVVGEHEAEKEAMLKEAMLSKYQALGEEQRKWEIRESRLVAQLESASSVSCDHEGFDVLQTKLAEAKELISDLESTSASQKLMIDERDAELGYLQAKLRRLEYGSAPATPSGLPGGMDGLGDIGTVSPTRETAAHVSFAAVLPTTSLSPTAPVFESVATSAMPLSTTSAGPLSVVVPTTPMVTSVPLTASSLTTVTSAPLPAVESISTSSTGPAVLPPTTLTAPAVFPVLSSSIAHRNPPVSPVSSLPPTTFVASTTPLLGQLPQISRFSGDEQQDGELFEDWHEQFEAVSGLAKWDDYSKLVNLTTRLRGTAQSFFRSCTLEQRSNYSLLVAELKKRFTPVRLTALQTRVFHDRHQGAKETVDTYAQKLLAKAYGTTSRETEAMGQTVLANQFVSGLRSELKLKVVGAEGSLEQLLAKARFEEAKRKELVNFQPPRKPPAPSNQLPSQGTTPRVETKRVSPSSGSSQGSGDRSSWKCFKCGMPGHLARACPYPRKPKGDQEAHGRKEPSVAHVTPVKEAGHGEKKTIEELRRELHEAELADGLESRSVTIKTVTWSDEAESVLGPIVISSVEVNGLPTEALLDTGSPVTIISLDFALDVLEKERPRYSSVEEWKTEAKKQFVPPTVTLKNYGGGLLDILAQLLVQITQGGYKVDTQVMVQKGAPNQLLLGTDVQGPLDFSC